MHFARMRPLGPLILVFEAVLSDYEVTQRGLSTFENAKVAL